MKKEKTKTKREKELEKKSQRCTSVFMLQRLIQNHKQNMMHTHSTVSEQNKSIAWMKRCWVRYYLCVCVLVCPSYTVWCMLRHVSHFKLVYDRLPMIYTFYGVTRQQFVYYCPTSICVDFQNVFSTQNRTI